MQVPFLQLALNVYWSLTFYAVRQQYFTDLIFFFYHSRGGSVHFDGVKFCAVSDQHKTVRKDVQFCSQLKKKLKFQAYSFFLHIQLIRNVPDVKMHAFLTFSELHDKINPSGMF